MLLRRQGWAFWGRMDRSRQGQAPYGFRWTGGKLEVVAEEARIRRVAFEQFLVLGTKGGVARKLTKMGLPTRRGAAWSDMQVGRILTCRSAIGEYALGGGDGPEGDEEAVVCDPIVSKPLWDQVQARLAGVRPIGAGASGASLGVFGGLVGCACGGSLERSGDGKWLVCSVCRFRKALEELEVTVVDDLVEMLVAHPRHVEALAPGSELSSWILELVDAEAAYDDARQERERLEGLMVASTITPARFAKLDAEAKRVMVEARRRLAVVKKRHPESQDRTRTAKNLLRASIRKRWNSFSSDRKRDVLRSMVDRIHVGPGGVQIQYHISDPASKEALVAQHYTGPTNQEPPVEEEPASQYLRLPKPGERCPVSGLSRAKLNQLILASERNNFRPPVASRSVKEPGATRGVRLIVRASLLKYLASHP